MDSPWSPLPHTPLLSLIGALFAIGISKKEGKKAVKRARIQICRQREPKKWAMMSKMTDFDNKTTQRKLSSRRIERNHYQRHQQSSPRGGSPKNKKRPPLGSSGVTWYSSAAVSTKSDSDDQVVSEDCRRLGCSFAPPPPRGRLALPHWRLASVVVVLLLDQVMMILLHHNQSLHLHPHQQ